MRCYFVTWSVLCLTFTCVREALRNLLLVVVVTEDDLIFMLE